MSGLDDGEGMGGRTRAPLDAWLRRDLAARYALVPDEPIPERLLTILAEAERADAA